MDFAVPYICLLFSGVSNVCHVWLTALERGCIANFALLVIQTITKTKTRRNKNTTTATNHNTLLLMTPRFQDKSQLLRQLHLTYGEVG